MIISNESMNFKDPKESDDPQLFDDPVTFPNLREGVLSVNSQIVSLKTFLSKRSFGNNSFVKVK